MAPIQQTDVIKTQVKVEGAERYEGDLLRGANALEKLAGAEGKASASSKQMLASTNALNSALSAFASLGIGTAIEGQVVKMVKSAAMIERFEAQFTVLMNSASRAHEQISRLYDFAMVTPFDLPGVIEADRMIQAFDMDLGGTEKTLRVFGDTAAATGKDISQVIGLMAQAKAGVFLMRQYGQIGITRTMLQSHGVAFDTQGQVLNREKLYPATLAILQKYSGSMDAMSKTTEGRIQNLEDSITRLSAALGKGLTPTVKVFTDLLMSGANAIERFDASTLKTISTIIALTGGVSLAFGAYRVLIAFRRADLLLSKAYTSSLVGETTARAANTVVVAQQTELEALENQLSEMRASGIGPRVIAQIRAEEMARLGNAQAAAAEATAVAASNASVAGTGSVGGAAIAGGLLGRLGGYGRALGGVAKIGGGILLISQAMDIYEKATRSPGKMGDNFEIPTPFGALSTMGQFALGGAAFGGPIGALLGAAAGAAKSIWDMSNAAEHNAEINESLIEENRKLNRPDPKTGRNWRQEGDWRAQQKADADALEALDKAVGKQKEWLSLLEAQAKIAGYRAMNEWQIIPYIEKQVEGAKAYEKFLSQQLENISDSEEGEKQRLAIQKELLSTTVEREGMERRIRDLIDKQHETELKHLELLKQSRREADESYQSGEDAKRAAQNSVADTVLDNLEKTRKLYEGRMYPGEYGGFDAQEDALRAQKHQLNLAQKNAEWRALDTKQKQLLQDNADAEAELQRTLQLQTERGTLTKEDLANANEESAARSLVMTTKLRELDIQKQITAQSADQLEQTYQLENALKQEERRRRDIAFFMEETRGTVDAMTWTRDLLERYGASIGDLRQMDDVVSVMRQQLAEFYSSAMNEAPPGTPYYMEARNNLFSVQQAEAADRMKRAEQEAKVFADVFFSSVTEGAAHMGKAFMGEVEQRALNAPSGLSELLPAPSTLARMTARQKMIRRMNYGDTGFWQDAYLDLPSLSRPAMGNTVLQFQINLSGTREDVLGMINDQFSRILDDQLFFEAQNYSVVGTE